ncbi:MAG TPA: choice-of-anchor D domain-containing protein [Ilumatobacteraceae bacterium]
MELRQRIRRWAVGGGFAVLAAAVGIGSPMQLGRAVADPAGPPSSGGSASAPTDTPPPSPYALLSPVAATTPTVSANGQYVVLVSAPGTDDGRTKSVWLDDRSTNTLTELTLPKDGIRVGDSVDPVISSDGCVVVATTEMSYDLFRDDDTGNRWDVYRLTLPACGGKPDDWSLVSTALNAQGQAEARNDVNPLETPALSSSGSVVAYVRPFVSLSGAVAIGSQPNAIDVVDLSIPIDDPGHTTQAPGLPTEVSDSRVNYIGAVSAAMSSDGTYVAFSSDATSNEAVPDWISPRGTASTVPSQVYVWNRSEADPFKAVTLVSEADNVAADQGAVQPAISADGRYVAFSSPATNLLSTSALSGCGTICPAQVYLVDRDTDNNQVFGEDGKTSITLLSAIPTDDGQSQIAGDRPSFAPSMTSDGQTVVFESQASNLMSIPTPGGGDMGDGDLLIADVGTGHLQRAFATATPTPGAYSHPHISANGRLLVADSLVADRLVAASDTPITGRHVVSAAFNPSVTVADSDVGTINVGVPGPEWYVNVINSGPGSFVPASVTIDNPAFAVTRGSCLDDAPVAAGQVCDVVFILTPTAVGPVTATLTVSEAGFGAITVTASISGAGGEPALASVSSGADLGSVVVGHNGPNPAHFDIENIGLTPADVTSVHITGVDAGDFKVSANGCGVGLAMAGTCGVEVVFKPTASGRRMAMLKVSTSLGQYTSMFLSGSGYYTPQLVGNSAVIPGQNLGIGGVGFPAKTAVTLGWSDGRGLTTTVITDARGQFLTTLFVLRGDRPGVRTFIAQAAGGVTVTENIVVRRVSTTGSSVATWAD